MTVKMGEFGGHKIIARRDCPKGFIYFMDSDYVYFNGAKVIWDDQIPKDQVIIWPKRKTRGKHEAK